MKILVRFLDLISSLFNTFLNFSISWINCLKITCSDSSTYTETGNESSKNLFEQKQSPENLFEQKQSPENLVARDIDFQMDIGDSYVTFGQLPFIKDEQLALKIVGSKWVRYLKYLPEEMRDNKKIILESIINHKFSFENASERLKNDWYFSLNAIKISPRSILYCGKSLKKNSLFIRESLQTNGLCYQWAPIYYKKIDDFAKLAIQNNYYAIEHVVKCLKENFNLIKLAISMDPDTFKFIPVESMKKIIVYINYIEKTRKISKHTFYSSFLNGFLNNDNNSSSLKKLNKLGPEFLKVFKGNVADFVEAPFGTEWSLVTKIKKNIDFTFKNNPHLKKEFKVSKRKKNKLIQEMFGKNSLC